MKLTSAEIQQIASMDILVYTPEEVEQWNGLPNHILTNVFKTGKVLYAA